MIPVSSGAGSRAASGWTYTGINDFHHALHHLLTGEADGYHQDFSSVAHLAKAFSDGFVYTGEYSRYRELSRGSACRTSPPAGSWSLPKITTRWVIAFMVSASAAWSRLMP